VFGERIDIGAFKRQPAEFRLFARVDQPNAHQGSEQLDVAVHDEAILAAVAPFRRIKSMQLSERLRAC
jgi:hypothetical protein